MAVAMAMTMETTTEVDTEGRELQPRGMEEVMRRKIIITKSKIYKQRIKAFIP